MKLITKSDNNESTKSNIVNFQKILEDERREDLDCGERMSKINNKMKTIRSYIRNELE